MKIIVAQSTVGMNAGVQCYGDALCAALEAEGHRTQRLDLPSIAAPERALTNLASFRLLGTEFTADALICLDAVAAVLRHRRKLVVMLDDAYLAADSAQLIHECDSERHFIANILRGAVGEADHIFTFSQFASKRLRALSLDRVHLLRPEFGRPTYNPAPRHAGPELLAMNALDDRQRPELLIACLAVLPEPFRARWIAPEASRKRLADLHQLAQDAGVEQRLSIDVRSVNAGEKSYLLSQAAALIDVAPGQLAVGDAYRQAIQTGVPVITCIDGGASVELLRPGSPAPAQVDPTALAAAIRAACAAPNPKSVHQVPPTRNRETSWAPLIEALTQ